ncbi:group 1 truncated hemoglobin [uncultured Tateyamaria sp.]|uniref:globin domain-containing protein n=1 Tax=uncultured Tateyamaria sp. TaxID=455651 RepID=UPI00342B34DA
MLDSDVVEHFFEDVDIAKLVDPQTKFFTAILGGPAEFADLRLAAAHAQLNVSHAHFDEIVTLLNQTLSDADFTLEDLDTTLAAVKARWSIIVRYYYAITGYQLTAYSVHQCRHLHCRG